jgi:hypothetical protein
MMSADIANAYYLDRTVTLSRTELITRSGLTETELIALVEAGALAAQDVQAWTFTVECLTVARTACRLRDELALDDTHALAVVLRLTQRIGELEDQLAQVQARLLR